MAKAAEAEYIYIYIYIYLKVAWLEVHGTTEFVFSNNIYICIYNIHGICNIYIYMEHIYIYIHKTVGFNVSQVEERSCMKDTTWLVTILHEDLGGYYHYMCIHGFKHICLSIYHERFL